MSDHLNWRAMRADDLPAVTTNSALVHEHYAESQETYAERLRLHAAGCRVCERDGVLVGFLVSHPWQGARPPALDERLGTLPGAPDSYYLHDIALLPAARGFGAGRAALGYVIDHARELGLNNITLVAVNGADAYWAANGFEIVAGGGYGEGTYLMRRELD